jgi:hypothetical protein
MICTSLRIEKHGETDGDGDSVMQPEGVNCIPVVVDLVSLGLLKGELRYLVNIIVLCLSIRSDTSRSFLVR